MHSAVFSEGSFTPVMRLFTLTVLILIATALFLVWDVKASWSFTFSFRGKKLITLILVGAAISIATLLFQTMSQNRILTPGIMGLDSLYILIQSILVMSLGIVGASTLNPYFKWALEASIMVGSVFILYKVFFKGTSKSLQMLMLCGIILGVLFSSITTLVVRILDPTEFVVFQDAMFATFGTVSPPLLQISWVVFLSCFLVIWRLNKHFDVMLLGEAPTTSLGVDYSKCSKIILILVAVLVSLSTALVGPVSFFGLLVVHVAYRLAGTFEHRILIPFAAMLGVFALVMGEFLLQHVFSFKTRLSIIIEFLGGLFFLMLILRQGKA